MRIVSCDRRIASAVLERSDDRMVIIDVSMAMSLPFPIAMLRSACARAALSFMPSPAIATTCPSACNCLTNAALSSGITFAL
ncbi:putative uncharacterized protein [Prevotella sp. CAG:487]|nr:putative uncharacterized protein [Prevotella sp. CAG:487]